jgi:hypothetical protein
MRCVLALGLLIALYASADGAAVHRSKLPIHLRGRQHFIVRPDPRVTAPTPRFAVPGWTDEQTQKWLDNGSAGSGLG